MFYLTAAEIQGHVAEVGVTAEAEQQGPAHGDNRVRGPRPTTCLVMETELTGWVSGGAGPNPKGPEPEALPSSEVT